MAKLTKAVICSFSDPTDYRINVSGTIYTFDFSERFGPSVMRCGSISDTQPRERHRFWIAVSWWVRQGKRVGDDGLCIWEIPKFRAYKISRRNYMSEEMYLDWRKQGKISELECVEFEMPL